jgi:hypothetical protein
VTDYVIKPDLYVQVKSVYGKDTVYPACESTKSFCELLSQTTLTERDIKHIKSLGFKVYVKHGVAEL